VVIDRKMPARQKKQRAGGMPLSFLEPFYREPSAAAGSNVNVSQVALARPVLNLTGGSRHSRRRSRRRVTRKRVMKGGFIPSVMGSFVQNAKMLLPAVGVNAYRMYMNFNKTRRNRY
jgi:hypothetical protein